MCITSRHLFSSLDWITASLKRYLGIRLGNIAKEIYLMQGGNRKNMEFELEFETLCRDLEDEVSKFCEIDDLARILTGTMISILRKIIKYSDDPSESLDRILRALSKKED